MSLDDKTNSLRRSSLSSRPQSLTDSRWGGNSKWRDVQLFNRSEREELHPAVHTDSERRRFLFLSITAHNNLMWRSLKSLPILNNAGELFRHPDIPSLNIDEVWVSRVRKILIDTCFEIDFQWHSADKLVWLFGEMPAAVGRDGQNEFAGHEAGLGL